MDVKPFIYVYLLYGLCKYCSCNGLGDLGGLFIPEYDIFKYTTEHSDLRKIFLLRKSQDKKMKLIDRTTNTVYVDGITHFESDHFSQKEKAVEFNGEFKKLVSMKEFKYMYKRDAHWRTWRELVGTGGNKTIISYKCQNSANSSFCGFWVIEEDTPPCPFEVFSVKDSVETCGAKLSQFAQKLGDCPSVIKFGELTAKCDNPIETTWRFTRIYNKDTKKARKREHLICGRKDFCELTTLYDITPQHVIFRLINASSDIIYSRVMKPERKNFQCVESCGKINLNTMKVTANDAPMSLNLLELKKKKREGERRLYYNTKGKSQKTHAPASIKRIVMYHANKIVQHNVSLPLRRTSTPMAMLPWLKIRRRDFEYYDNILDNDTKGDYTIHKRHTAITGKCLYCSRLFG